MLNDELLFLDIDPIADIIGMLDEEEDAAGEELCHRFTNAEGQTSNRCPNLCSMARKSLAEEQRVEKSNC